jgi:hypothetical protein
MTNRQPTHTVFTIDKRSEKGFWTTVGAVWAHQDGKGLTVRLNLVPVGGHDIVIRKSKPKATTDQTDDDIPLELAQRAALPSAALFHERATALAGGLPVWPCYSTVTDFARLRGWSTSVPMTTAVW